MAVIDGDDCPAERFLLEGEDTTKSSRHGLVQMLEKVAEEGLQGVPAAWFHEADKSQQIYEFIKGSLRLFFFKGRNGQIAVCTAGVRKSGRKADKAAVARAARWRDDYFRAIESNALIMVSDDGT